jgi:hypothetical protein
MKFTLITDHSRNRVLDQYYKSTARVSIITGPLGSGKTFTSCEKIFYWMCNQQPDWQKVRRTRFYAIRNTYPDLLGTTVKDWRDLFDELGKYKGGGIEPPSHTLHFRLRDKTIVQSEFIFLALDRPQAVKKLRGAQATGFWLNEIKELPKAILDMCDLRHGRYPSKVHKVKPTWHGIIGDTNQVDDDHWLYTLAEETKPKNWHFFTQPGALVRNIGTGMWDLNPKAENIENLPSDYYEQGAEGKDEDWIKVNFGNLYGSVADGKPIYKEQWNDFLHINPDIVYNPECTLYAGLDFGLTPAAVFVQISPKGRVHVLSEVVSVGSGINQFYEFAVKPHLLENYKDANIVWVGDPSGNKRAETDEQTVFKELQELNVDIDAANTNVVLVRIEAVRFFLGRMASGRPAFQMHPRCKMLRKGFNGRYQFRRMRVIGEERYKTEPSKNKFSHIHDALQYVCLEIRGQLDMPKTVLKRSATSSRWAM